MLSKRHRWAIKEIISSLKRKNFKQAEKRLEVLGLENDKLQVFELSLKLTWLEGSLFTLKMLNEE